MVVPADEVVQKLEAARALHPDGLVAFDADGTLWDGDVGVDLFESALRQRALRPEAAAALSAEARRAGLDVAGDANDQAEILYAAFVAEKLDERVMFETMAWAFAGFDDREMRDFAAHVLANNGLLARITRELDPVLTWARERRVDVLVVSASPRAIVEPGVSVRGLSNAGVIAMTPLQESRRIAPGVVAPAPYAEGKWLAIEKIAAGRVLLGAFGDSRFDAAMLARALVPVMVRPKEALRKMAKDIAGTVEIERARGLR